MSTAVTTTTQYTPEELLAMPDGDRFELVDGQLVERNMGLESSWVGGEVYLRLRLYCGEHHLGPVLPAGSGYQCFPHRPALVRRPDVSFIRGSRLPGKMLPKGWSKIPPDLAVEVVSPDDLAEDLAEKLDDHVKAGVPLVWVIYLKSRTAMVRRGDGTLVLLHEDDELAGEDVVPGFRCPVREILPAREPTEGFEPRSVGPEGLQ